MAVCVAVIGKENSPKYILCTDPDLELSFHYKVHTSLDVVEEKLSTVGKTSGDLRELYLGLLLATEQHKIFGFVTNTKVKFIIVVESSNTMLRDNEVRSMFRKLHSAYMDVVCNPFYIPGDAITSKRFLFSARNYFCVKTAEIDKDTLRSVPIYILVECNGYGLVRVGAESQRIVPVNRMTRILSFPNPKDLRQLGQRDYERELKFYNILDILVLRFCSVVYISIVCTIVIKKFVIGKVFHLC